MQPYFAMLESVTVARSFLLITQNIENAILTFTLDMEKASNQRLFMKTQKKEPQDFPHGSRKKKKYWLEAYDQQFQIWSFLD